MGKITKKHLLFLGILLFLWFAYYAATRGVQLYIADSFVFIGILIVFYYLYEHLRMTPFSYSMLIIACALHNAGVFGWYYKSPLPYIDPFWQQHISAHIFQWDHITHLVGIFTITYILFQYLSQYFKGKNVLTLSVLIVLAGMGVGVVIEHYEFLGSLTVGEGEGGLGKGGAGDYTLNDWASSDWLNVMWDLVYNSIGAILAVGVGLVNYKRRN
tara:strand:- start:15124 stop:15765 length:642 start_codon:yes stop_codon:yes gene_type:complete